jgi:hypothetical protein
MNAKEIDVFYSRLKLRVSGDISCNNSGAFGEDF